MDINKSKNAPVDIIDQQMCGLNFYFLYFIATGPNTTSRNMILHKCAVPENMPLHHAVAMAWDNFDQKKSVLSQQTKQGMLAVSLTTEPELY